MSERSINVALQTGPQWNSWRRSVLKKAWPTKRLPQPIAPHRFKAGKCAPRGGSS